MANKINSKIGFRKVKAALLTETTTSATYGSILELAASQTASLSVTKSAADLYGDDILQDHVEEFVSGTLQYTNTGDQPEIEDTLLGKVTDGMDNINDSPPFFGLGFISPTRKTGTSGVATAFAATVFPKVKFAVGDESYQTKGDSTTYQSTNYNVTIFADNNGDWRHREFFDNEADAVSFIETQFGVTP